MEMRRYWEVLLRRKAVVAATLIVTLIVVFLGTLRMTPVYSASATVRIAEGRGGVIGYMDLNYAERLMNTYVQLLKSRPFLEQVIQKLSLSTQPDVLSGAIKVEALANTELLKITATAANPADAPKIANGLAELLVAQGRAVYTGPGVSSSQILQGQLSSAQQKLEADRASLAAMQASTPSAAAAATGSDPSIAQLTNQINLETQAYLSLLGQYNAALLDESTRGNSVSIAEPAVAPLAPNQPRREFLLALGFLVGLLGGLGLAFLLDNLDPTLHSADRLEAVSGMSLLGGVPEYQTSGKNGGIAISDSAEGNAAGEAFRLLSATVLALPQLSLVGDSKLGRTLLVSSAEPQTGKSTILANLAVAMAGTGHRVVVVDADLRQPSLHRLFGLPNRMGLVDALLTPEKLEAAVQETSVPGVRVLTSGTVGEGSPALLGSPWASGLVRKLAEDADVVLLDSSSLLVSADAAILGSLVDGVLLVVSRDQTTAAHLEQAAVGLQRVGARTLGIIFNRAKAGRADRPPRSLRAHTAASNSALAGGSRSYLWAKRSIDLVLSILALVVLSPFLLAIAIAIRLDSRGPVIFSQERMGYDWRRHRHTTFALHKFRSMVHNADQSAHKQFIREWIRTRKSSTESGDLVKLTNDPRVTRIGRFLRRTSLDELPQLWNVLKGDMSLVGPRPVPLYEVEEYEPWHKQRLQVTPGITCVWQVRGRGHSNIDEMVQMDMEYIQNQSLLLDLKLLLHTIPVVLTGRGAA